MKCPKRTEQFEKSISVLTEIGAFNAYKYNGENDLNLAPNGKESVLYSKLVELTGNEFEAIEMKAKVISSNNTYVLDDNKEPVITYANPNIGRVDFSVEEHQEGLVPVITKEGAKGNTIVPLFSNGEFNPTKNRDVVKVPVFVTKNGNIPISRTEDISLKAKELFLSGNYDGDSNTLLFDKLTKGENQLTGFMVMKKLESMFPQLTFNYHLNSSVHKKFGRDNKHGWVDNNGEININLDKFNAKTALHELGHILEPLIEETYPDMYKSVMDSLEVELENKNPFYLQVYHNAKKQGLKNHKERMSEVFSESLATTTLTALEGKLENIEDIKNSKGIFSKLTRLFDKVRKAVIKMFSDTFKGVEIHNMVDLGKAMATQMENNEEVKFSGQQLNFIQSHFQENGYKFSEEVNDKKSKVTLQTTKQLDEVLGNSVTAEDRNYNEAKRRVDEAIRKAKKVGEKTYNVSIGEDIKIFDINTTYEEQVTRMYDEVILPQFKFKVSIQSNLVKAFSSTLSLKENGEMLELAGKHTSLSSMQELYRLTGLSEHTDELMLYSELKNHKNPAISKLYHEDLVNDDYVVAIHNFNEETNTPTISITHIHPFSLNESRNIESNASNIFSEFMPTDEEYYAARPNNDHRKVFLKNTGADRSNFIIGMLIQHIKNVTDNNIIFNKAGTINVSPKSTTGKMIYNFEGLNQNISILKSIDGVKESLKNGPLKDILFSVDDVKKDTKQNTLGHVMSWLEDIAAEEDESTTFKYIAEDLLKRLDIDDLRGRIETLDIMKSMLKADLKGYATSNGKYQMLARASRELRTGKLGTVNDLKDMASFAVKIQSAYHMKNDYVQDVVEAQMKAQMLVSKKAMEDIHKVAGTTRDRGLMRNVFDTFFADNPHIGISGLGQDIGSKVYKHLYKTKVVKVFNKGIDTGRTKEVTLPEIHYTLDDADTKAAYDKGLISDTDLEAANAVLDTMKQRWIDYIYHSESRKQLGYRVSDEKKFTKEDAEEEYNKLFSDKGLIPVIEKSTSELLFSGEFKKSAKKGFAQASASEALFDDAMLTSGKNNDFTSKVGGFFMNQLTYADKLSAVGLKTINGEITLMENHESKNDNASTDLWKTFSYFDVAVLRKIQYENHVLPIAEDSLVLLEQLEQTGYNQRNNKAFIERYINKNVHRQNEDDKDNFDIANNPVNVPGITRLAKGVYNKAVLPFKASIGLASGMFNASRLGIEGLAATLSKSDTTMPGVVSMSKAMAMTFNPAHVKKLQQIALTHHVFGRTESDIMTNPWINVTEMSAANETATNIFNWGTDTWARTLIMTAVMIDDGSIDAYSYDKESGDVEYDETKDKRFYDEKGIRKGDQKSKALYEGVMKDVMEFEGQTERPSKLSLGYGINDSLYMKQLADTKVIGAFSDDVAATITSDWIGNLFGQFRQFSTVRLFNFGVYSKKRKSTIGQRIVAVPDPDNKGEFISKKQVQELEGWLHSVNTAMITLKNADGTMLENWETLDETTRYNTVKAFVTASTFVMMWGLMQAAGDDEDKWKYDKTNWAYWGNKFMQDIFIMNIVLDINRSPIPALDALIRVWDKGEYQKLMPYSGVISETATILEEEEK